MGGRPVITILTTTTANAVLAKTITQTAEGWSKADYAQAFHYDVATFPVNDIADLSELLTELEGQERSCVIRGKLIDGMTGEDVLRRIYPDSETGEPAYFEAAPAQWLCCDFDHTQAPDADMTNEARLEHLIQTLPAYFHNTSYHYQWSSSAGLDGWKVLKCHLWFWLSRPITDADLKMVATFQKWPCDKALMSAVQVHYTAAPRFTNCSDPLAGLRSGVVAKDRQEVTIPAHIVPMIRQAEVEAVEEARRANAGRVRSANHRVGEILATIGPDYHEPITKAIAHYVATTPADQVNREWLKDEIRLAVAGAIAGARPKSEYTNEAYLNRSISGAIRKFTCMDAPRADYRNAKQLLRRKKNAK